MEYQHVKLTHTLNKTRNYLFMEIPHRPRKICKGIFFFLKSRGTPRESVRFRGVVIEHVDGLTQGCSISSALSMEILLYCIKPPMCWSSRCLQMICGSDLAGITAWTSNNTEGFMWNAITHPCHNFNGDFTKPYLKKSMSNYIPPLYVDTIIYPCPDTDSGLAYLC